MLVSLGQRGDSDFSCQQLGRQLPGRITVRPPPNPNFRRVDAQVFAEAQLPIVNLSTVLPRARCCACLPAPSPDLAALVRPVASPSSRCWCRC